MNRYFCKSICPNETPFEYILTQECVNYCKLKDLKFNKCKLDKFNYNIEEFDIINILLKNYEIGITSPEYDTSSIEKGEDDIYDEVEEKMRIVITTTKNQNQNKNNNMSIIDLAECKNILRKKYKLSENELLYIKMIDIYDEGMKIPKVVFDIYSKFSGNNLKKLNLSICENSKYYLYNNAIIEGNIDKYNASSGYYNDACYKALSDTGTDIILKDRRKEFIDRNKTLCQEDCIFSRYDNVTKKAECTCKIKQSSLITFKDIKINKTKLYNNFIDINNVANIKLVKCYKELFSKDGIIINIAFFII